MRRLSRAGIFDFVLRLAEDHAQHALLLAELIEDVAVMHFQIVAVAREQRRPGVLLRHDRRFVVRRQRALVGHLQEQQVRELLEIVAVGDAIVFEHITKVPELINQVLRQIFHLSKSELKHIFDPLVQDAK